MLRFSADLFRIAYLSASSEETRYYLKGVFIRPTFTGEPGALMVATDGHTLVCLYDPTATGVPDDGVILTLDKVKPGKLFTTGRQEKPRQVRFADGMATVYTTDNVEGEADSLQGGVPMRVIDGSFPDFSRVVPSLTAPEGEDGKPVYCVSNPFNAALVSRMADIGGELGKLRGERDGVCVIEERGNGNPALVRYPMSNALGVIMPMRAERASRGDSLAWYRKQP